MQGEPRLPTWKLFEIKARRTVFRILFAPVLDVRGWPVVNMPLVHAHGTVAVLAADFGCFS